MSFLCNYFPSPSGCLPIKVVLNLLVASWQDWFFFSNASELNVNYRVYPVTLVFLIRFLLGMLKTTMWFTGSTTDKCKWSCELASRMSGFPRSAGGRCCGSHPLLAYASVLLLLEAASEMDAGSRKDGEMLLGNLRCAGAACGNQNNN